MYVVTARTVRFVKNGKVRVVRRDKLSPGHAYAIAPKPPGQLPRLTKAGARRRFLAAEAEALKIEGNQK